MDPHNLPRRVFADRSEPQADRVNQYFKLNTIRAVIKALQPAELERIRPCFGKLLDIYSKPVFSGKLAHFLLTRQLDVVKRHEIWCVFAGKPIRFSLREFSLVTGLNCSPLPPLDPSMLKCPPGVTPYWFTLFGGEESFTGEMLLAKLRRPKSLTEEMRIKYACLLLVDGFLCRRSFHMKIPKEHVEMIRDLDVFLNYPWGRFSFDMTMKCIKTRSPNQLAQATVAIQGFIHALLLVFSEAVPALLSATGDETDPESGEEEDFPVVSFKLDKIWELDAEEGVQVLPIIPSAGRRIGDCSWTDEVPDPRVAAMMQLIEEGTVFRRQMFVGGIQGLDAPVVAPSRVVNKGKRKVNVRVCEASAESSKSKKTKLRSTQSKSPQFDPNSKLMAAVSSEIRAALEESQADVSSQIKAGLAEAQAVVYATVSVDMKVMESRLETHIKETVAEYMISKDTMGDILKDIDGYANHVEKTGGAMPQAFPNVMNQSKEPQISQLPTEHGTLSNSLEDASDGVVVGEEVPVPVQNETPTTVCSTNLKFKKLISKLDAATFVDSSHGLVLKGNELLNIPTIIPPDNPQVMDACVSVLRDSLFKNIDPCNDPRADMLPCKFYGALAFEYAKFKKFTHKAAFEFNSDLVNSVTERCQELGKEWLKDIDFLYSPFNIDKNRWVGLVVDLRMHTLTVFDCTAAARRGSRLKPELEFICEMFPYFVRQVGGNDLMKKNPIEPLTFIRNTQVTQASVRANTGILSLLFLEAHAVGGSEQVRLVTEVGLRQRAEQLAVEMYEHCHGELSD